jgi:hypothetical protein
MPARQPKHKRSSGMRLFRPGPIPGRLCPKSGSRLVRWLDFAKGALLFLMVPGDNEPGTFYIYDRDRSSFYPLSLPIEQGYGGFREEEFESLTKAFDLVALARNPRVLRP